MKFVCTECDEPMKFDTSGGLEDDGTMSAMFRCPSCEWGVTMLINPQETQMVRSLGVKIGGQTVPAQPMDMLQTHLASGTGALTEASQDEAGSCPFASMMQGAFPAAPSISSSLHWTAEAEQRLERAPSFVRAMVRRGVEDLAREKGYTAITEEVMDEARTRMGM